VSGWRAGRLPCWAAGLGSLYGAGSAQPKIGGDGFAQPKVGGDGCAGEAVPVGAAVGREAHNRL